MSPSPDSSLPLRSIAQWRELIAGGGDPLPWLQQCRSAALGSGELALWISLASDAQWQAQLARLSARLAEPLTRAELVQRYPLLGVPFAVKDNIDIAGVPTTAACKAFERLPERSATVVQRLLDAGALWLGKTNLDQFATGLVGTRSPYGRPASVFDASRISGGSSSGSAVAVARGQAAFALGTDTAGSGRVPAGFNNLVGPEADARAHQHRRRAAGLPQHRLRLAVHAHGRRCRAAAGAGRRRRRAGRLQRLRLRPGATAHGGAHRRAQGAGLLRRRRLCAAVRRGRRTRAQPRPSGGGAGLRAAVRGGGAALRRPVGGRAPQRGARAVRRPARRLRPRGAPDPRPRGGLQRHRHLRRAVPPAAHAARAAGAVAAGGRADGAHRARPSAFRRDRCRPAGRECAAGHLHQLRQPAGLVRAGAARRLHRRPDCPSA